MHASVLCLILLVPVLSGCLDDEAPPVPDLTFEGLRVGARLEVGNTTYHLRAPVNETDALGNGRQLVPFEGDLQTLWFDQDTRGHVLTTWRDDPRREGPASLCSLPASPFWLVLLAGRDWPKEAFFNMSMGAIPHAITVVNERPLTLALSIGGALDEVGTTVQIRYDVGRGDSLFEVGAVNLTLSSPDDRCARSTGVTDLRVRLYDGSGAVLPFGAGDEELPDRRPLLWPPRLEASQFVFPLAHAVAALEANEEFRAFRSGGEVAVQRVAFAGGACDMRWPFAQSWHVTVLRDDGATAAACVERQRMFAEGPPIVQSMAQHAGETPGRFPSAVGLEATFAAALAQYPEADGEVIRFTWNAPEETSILRPLAFVEFGTVNCRIDVATGLMRSCDRD